MKQVEQMKWSFTRPTQDIIRHHTSGLEAQFFVGSVSVLPPLPEKISIFATAYSTPPLPLPIQSVDLKASNEKSDLLLESLGCQEMV